MPFVLSYETGDTILTGGLGYVNTANAYDNDNGTYSRAEFWCSYNNADADDFVLYGYGYNFSSPRYITNISHYSNFYGGLLSHSLTLEKNVNGVWSDVVSLSDNSYERKEINASVDGLRIQLSGVNSIGASCADHDVYEFDYWTAPPSLTNYNVTSAYLNYTAWRTNISEYVYTKDRTPTVTFNINVPSNCSIGLNDWNYTYMVANNSDTKCSTTETTSHSCTLPTSQQLPYQPDDYIYISCSYEETNESTSGALAIKLTVEPVINDLSIIKNSDKSVVTNPFKELVYLTINATDAWSNTHISGVYVTINKSSEYLMNGINATKNTNMSIWNTTTFRFNETGTWEIEIEAENDNFTTTYRENVTISDVLSPIYLSYLPASMTQNTQATFSLTFYDASNITQATFTLRDPDSSLTFVDELMTYYSSVQNTNGTRNTTYRRTYTPILSGNYVIVNKTATDEYSNLYTNSDPITINSAMPVIPPTSGGGGGGGGGTTIIEAKQTSNFTISPTSDSFTVAPGSERVIEFTITNLESRDITVKVSISATGDESRNWVKFQDGTQETFINVTTASGLQSNKRIVRYTVAVPDDALEKDYSFKLLATTESQSTFYDATVTVGDSFLTFFNKKFWSTDIEYCTDDAFSTTDAECQNLKTYKLGFGIREIAVIIILAILATLYFDGKDRKRGR